jgi:PadR family transcriptional regulator PadR
VTDQRPGEWITQARRGILELCILALIGQKTRYGYELTVTLSRWDQLAATEGTLYPMLRRLQKDGMITSEWQESVTGPPRKYYRLTPAGTAALRSMSDEWRKLAEAVKELQELEADGLEPSMKETYVNGPRE